MCPLLLVMLLLLKCGSPMLAASKIHQGKAGSDSKDIIVLNGDSHGTGVQPSALQTLRCQALLSRRLWAMQLFPQPAPEAPADWHTASNVASQSVCCFHEGLMVLKAQVQLLRCRLYPCILTTPQKSVKWECVICAVRSSAGRHSCFPSY